MIKKELKSEQTKCQRRVFVKGKILHHILEDMIGHVVDEKDDIEFSSLKEKSKSIVIFKFLSFLCSIDATVWN